LKKGKGSNPVNLSPFVGSQRGVRERGGSEKKEERNSLELNKAFG